MSGKAWDRTERFVRFEVRIPQERTRVFEDEAPMLAWAFKRAMSGADVTIVDAQGYEYVWVQTPGLQRND